MNRKRSPFGGVVPLGLPIALALLFAMPMTARAQKADIIPDEIKKQDEIEKERLKKIEELRKAKKRTEGWFPSVKAGFTFAFSQNQGVVGLPDGMTLSLGVQLTGGLLFRKGTHEWNSVLMIQETQSKVPNIEFFIKSADLFDLNSVYTYRLPQVKWFGFFAGVRLTATMLPGNLVKDADTNTTLQEVDGTVNQRLLAAQTNYHLTDAFFPLYFKQSAGAVFRPYKRPWLDVDLKLGAGAIEVWTAKGKVVADDKATKDVLELKRLQDYVQGGIELQVNLTGKALKADILTYGFQFVAMYPFATSIETSITGVDLFNVEARLQVGVKLWKWASLNYALAIVRTPLISPDWQITNNLLLSITASWMK
jgi:hypothetical protein